MLEPPFEDRLKCVETSVCRVRTGLLAQFIYPRLHLASLDGITLSTVPLHKVALVVVHSITPALRVMARILLYVLVKQLFERQIHFGVSESLGRILATSDFTQAF